MTKAWWQAVLFCSFLSGRPLTILSLLLFSGSPLTLCFSPSTFSSLSIFVFVSCFWCFYCSSFVSCFSSVYVLSFSVLVCLSPCVYSPVLLRARLFRGVVQPETRLAGACALVSQCFSLFLSRLLFQSSLGFSLFFPGLLFRFLFSLVCVFGLLSLGLSLSPACPCSFVSSLLLVFFFFF